MVTVKAKALKNPWITKGIVKSSKTKQKLCYKSYKSKKYRHELFQLIKQRANRNITQR